MKRILTILAVVFVIAAMTLSISAAISPTVKCEASASEVNIGDMVTITVLLENCPRIKTLGITPVYDDGVFELISGEWLLKDGLIADFNKTTGDGVFTYTEDKDCNGSIFKFVLKAKATSIFGENTVSATAILQNSDYTTNIGYISVKTNVTIKTVTTETTPATTPTTTPATTPATDPATDTPTSAEDTTAAPIENDTLETADEPIGTVDKTDGQTDKTSPEETDTTAIGEKKPMNAGKLWTVIIASVVAIAAIVGIVVIKLKERRM